jgi:hypothetical protein
MNKNFETDTNVTDRLIKKILSILKKAEKDRTEGINKSVLKIKKVIDEEIK